MLAPSWYPWSMHDTVHNRVGDRVGAEAIRVWSTRPARPRLGIRTAGASFVVEMAASAHDAGIVRAIVNWPTSGGVRSWA